MRTIDQYLAGVSIWIGTFRKFDLSLAPTSVKGNVTASLEPCWALAWMFLVQCGEACFPQIHGRGARFRKAPTCSGATKMRTAWVFVALGRPRPCECEGLVIRNATSVSQGSSCLNCDYIASSRAHFCLFTSFPSLSTMEQLRICCMLLDRAFTHIVGYCVRSMLIWLDLRNGR